MAVCYDSALISQDEHRAVFLPPMGRPFCTGLYQCRGCRNRNGSARQGQPPRIKRRRHQRSGLRVEQMPARGISGLRSLRQVLSLACWLLDHYLRVGPVCVGLRPRKKHPLAIWQEFRPGTGEEIPFRHPS
jgi:hypothetical protein